MAFESKTVFRHFNDMQDIEVLKFSACSKGHFAQVTFNHKRQYKEKLFKVSIFPCGHFLDNEDYISIFVSRLDSISGMDYDSVTWTVSVIDVSGTQCFLHSFTKEDFLFMDEDFGLVRFLSRHILLDRREEFFPNDVLILRCEVTYMSQIGPSAEGNLFFVYASEEELDEASKNGFKETNSKEKFHVVLKLKDDPNKGEDKFNFFQLVDFTDLHQAFESGYDWTEEDFVEELNKRQSEIKKYLGMFWKNNLFCSGNICDLKETLLQFLTVKNWVEDISIPFTVQESNIMNIIDMEISEVICKMFEWNKTYHQNFVQSEPNHSIKKWEQSLENLRFQTVITLENYIQELFEFQIKLQDIGKESKVDIQNENVDSGETVNIKQKDISERKLRFPFLLMWYLFAIFLFILYFFETELLETLVHVLYFFFAVLYMHTDEDKRDEGTVETVNDNTKEWTLLVETKDHHLHLIPFKEGAKSLGSQLRAASPVFDRMLATPMKEKLERSVKLENVDSISFDNFLYFLKTGKLKVGTLKDIFNLYEMADEFAVIGLMHACAESISGFLSVENVDEIRAYAALHSDRYLMKLTDKYLSRQEYLENFLYQ